MEWVTIVAVPTVIEMLVLIFLLLKNKKCQTFDSTIINARQRTLYRGGQDGQNQKRHLERLAVCHDQSF